MFCTEWLLFASTALQHWEALDIEGPMPVPRDAHAAACVGYGGDNPQLLITGGLEEATDEEEATLSDVWLFDLQTKQWREVSWSDVYGKGEMIIAWETIIN